METSKKIAYFVEYTDVQRVRKCSGFDNLPDAYSCYYGLVSAGFNTRLFSQTTTVETFDIAKDEGVVQ